MTTSRALLVGLLSVLWLAFAGVARADEAAARQHFKRGIELYDAKKFAEAEKAFRDAYAERPSAGIKQNIALSLKGQNKIVEAATLLDEALDEGQTTLKPETKSAIERELADLAKLIGTVNVKIVTLADRKPVDNATLVVDDVPRNWHRPIRVTPDAVHVFKAHVDGVADPPEKRLAPVAGAPVDATFEVGAATGTLTIRPNVPNAAIAVDGTVVAHGTWTGPLSPGVHRVTIAASDYQTTTADVTITSGTAMDYQVVLGRPVGEAPRYEGATPPPPPGPDKKWYVLPLVGFDSTAYRFGPGLREPDTGTKRQVSGYTLGARGGYRFSRFFAFELLGEYGSGNIDYTLAKNTGGSDTTVWHWQITPSIRFTTIGKARFTVGGGLGLAGTGVDATLRPPPPAPSTPATIDRKSDSTIGATTMFDVGFQADTGPVFLFLTLFAEFRGVKGLNADVGDKKDQAMLMSSPATRGGAHFGIGIPF